MLPWRRRGALASALGGERFRVASRVPRSIDVTWFPANGTFFTSRAPVVATLHDAVPFRYPHGDPKARLREQQPFEKTVRSARAFVAVSEFGKSELCAVFRLSAERIETIYHGVDERFAPGETGGLPAGLRQHEYVLFVGDPAEPRKNFAMLYDAYRAAWPASDGPRLVVAGTARPPRPDVVVIDRLGDDLQSAGRDQLLALYRGALAVVVPSYHETFGMPLIEAMACGTPAIASRASALAEIGGDAAYYAPPHERDAWSLALRTLAEDAPLRARLRTAGIAHAARFRWEASTEKHLDLFRRIASRAGA